MAASSDDGWAVWLIGIACILAYAAYEWLSNRHRIRDLEEFLFSIDFIPGISTDWKPFKDSEPRISKLERVYDGTYSGYRAIVADFRIGVGKGSYSQTFIAVERATDEPVQAVTLTSALWLEYHQSGRWLVGTVIKQTLGAEAVEGYLKCFT